MEHRTKYILSQVTNLRLTDLKAQKRTITMKKFRNLALSPQQVMQQKFSNCTQQSICQQQNEHKFRIRLNPHQHQRLLDRLANPKGKLTSQSQRQQVSYSQTIISKCSKLKDRILTGNRIDKIRKYTERDYGTLLEQSKWCLAVHCRKG